MAAARRFVADTLADTGFDPWPATLLLSELAANVVEHARSPLVVEVTVGSTVRVAVHDGSSIVPAVQDAAADADRGRGLALVDALAIDWGVATRDDGNGKSIWFEVEPEATSPPR